MERAPAQKPAVACLCLWAGGWVKRVGFYFWGVASIPGWMVKSAAQQKCIPRLGGALHGFHDYQVLWLGCGFGSVVA